MWQNRTPSYFSNSSQLPLPPEEPCTIQTNIPASKPLMYVPDNVIYNVKSIDLSAISGSVLECLPMSSLVHTTSSTTTTVYTSSTTTTTTAVTTRISLTTNINTHAPPGSASECEGGGHRTTKEEKKPVGGRPSPPRPSPLRPPKNLTEVEEMKTVRKD